MTTIGRRLGIRRGIAGLHAAVAAATVAGVCLQVYLIGAYIFGGDPAVLDAHRDAGFTVHGLELLVGLLALAAWLPRADLLLSLLLAVAGTAQIAFAAADGPWVAALHPLGALLVLALGTALARRGVARLRAAESGGRPGMTEQGGL